MTRKAASAAFFVLKDQKRNGWILRRSWDMPGPGHTSDTIIRDPETGGPVSGNPGSIRGLPIRPYAKMFICDRPSLLPMWTCLPGPWMLPALAVLEDGVVLPPALLPSG